MRLRLKCEYKRMRLRAIAMIMRMVIDRKSLASYIVYSRSTASKAEFDVVYNWGQSRLD